jgi:hypothetical protein
MIGNSAIRDLLWALNIPAPAEFGMQRQANSVSQILETVNKEDMSYRLTRLMDKCKYQYEGKTYAPIIVEGDCRYNNPLGSSTGKTPYQPATQAVYTIAESLTPKKQVLAVVCKNKLCKKAESLRQSGQPVTCPDHSGHCSANIKPEDSIGNEGRWASEGFTSMFEDHPDLAFKYFTTDGDSRAFTGLESVHGQFSTVQPIQMRDPRHLSENMRHAVAKASFSPDMFPGRTKTARDQQQHNFALELSKRCTAEFDTCHKLSECDFQTMRRLLAHVPETLICCYQGDCSKCDEHSLVCGTNKKFPWKKGFQPKFMFIKPNSADKKKLLTYIAMRLGPDMLAKTFLNTSTQKCEAFNRTLSRCNPKSVTLKRNFSGIIHSAAHLSNCGIAKSTITKCAAVGAPLSDGTRVVDQLKTKDRRIEYIRQKMKSPKYKAGRIDRRMKRYQEYHDKKAVHVVHYSKGLLDNPDPALRDHSYAVHVSEGKCPGTSGPITRLKHLRKGTLN